MEIIGRELQKKNNNNNNCRDKGQKLYIDPWALAKDVD